MKRLADKIRSGQVPADLDLEEVFEFWYKGHKVAPIQKSWASKPRFYNRAMTANTRSKKLGDGSKITADDLEAVYSRCNGKCLGCGTTKYLVFDHIVPYYRGGTNTVDNLQVLCRTCNMEKGVQ